MWFCESYACVVNETLMGRSKKTTKAIALVAGG